MAVGAWGLWRDNSVPQTVLRKTIWDGSTFSDGPAIVCPDLLTHTNPTGDGFSTCVLRSWPVDREIVYFAGRSDTDGHMKAWRYDGHADTFNLLLDVVATSGTWPFATGMWLSHAVPEQAWLVTGNGSGWGVFLNQNIDAAQAVFYSLGGGAFTSQGDGHNNAYAHSNVNNPNSLMDILVVEGLPPTLYVSHSPTKTGSNPPNTFPFWQMVDISTDNGVTWSADPHLTGLQFVGGWTNLFSPISTGWYEVSNGGGIGPNTFLNQNFGTDWTGGGESATGLGAYHSNAACLVFQDSNNILLAFSSNTREILRYIPRTGSVVNTATNGNWGIFSPTCCRLAESGGGAVGLTCQRFGFGTVVLSDDYGASWQDHSIADYAGLAVDEAYTEPHVPTVNRESLTWRDDRMFYGITRYYVFGETPGELEANAQGIADLLVAVSNAYMSQASGPYNTAPVLPLPGAHDTYNMVEMVVRFTWLTDEGVPIYLDVPCPQEAIFLDNQEVAAILNPDVAAIMSDVVAFKLCTRGGGLATQYIGTTRIMRPFRSTENIRTKSPDETTMGE